MKSVAPADFIRHFQTASDWLPAAIVDQNVDCIKLIALDGTLEYVNRAGRRARGIDEYADVTGTPWWSLWPPEAQDRVRDGVRRARAGETVRFEAPWPTPDGEPRWWDVNVGPIRDPDGEMRGLVSIAREITTIVAARETAEAMAAEMAHRLRNAYTVTSALLSAAARGDPAREQFAREVSRQFMHLGAAQALMLSNGDGTTSLEALVTELTRGFARESAPIRIGKLPDLELDGRKVQPLALTIGELCANAAKYGAIGHGGDIMISATREGPRLSILWSEKSEKPVENIARAGGKGFALIRRVLAAQKGAIEIEWRENGLDATITMAVE